MKRIAQGIGTSIGVILALGLSIGFASGTKAQTDSSPVTIHKSECPAGYAGENYFEDCHSNPVAGVTFQWTLLGIGYPQEAATDENGAVTFYASAPGLGMKITEENVGSLAKYVVYCSKNDGAEAVDFKYREGEVAILIPTAVLAVGDSVVCDWYDVPPATQNGDGQSTQPEPEPGEAVTLPSTGVGSAVADDHDAAPPLILMVLLVLIGGTALVGFRYRPS